MPSYDYECARGHTVEAFRSIDNRHDAPTCHCGAATQKIANVVMGFVSFPAAAGQEYVSPVSGKYITSMRERRDDMARTGSRPWEGMEQEKKEAARRVAADEKRSDAVLHDNVSKAYYELSPDKRAVLNG